MASTKERVFAFLDETYGGDTIEDYDSPEKFLEYAIESVGEEDGLTCGCGVGPLIHHIEAWVMEFKAGKRNRNANTEMQEEFILKISFNPAKLGYHYFVSEQSLRALFPVVHEMPQSYPVFAKEIMQIQSSKKDINASVLAYIERCDVGIDT